MTSNDFETKTLELCYYAYLMKALNPDSMKIGRKHMFDLSIASNYPLLPLMTSNDFETNNI